MRLWPFYSQFFHIPALSKHYSTFCSQFFPPQHLFSSQIYDCYYKWKDSYVHIYIIIHSWSCTLKRIIITFIIQNGFYYVILFFTFSMRIIVTGMTSPYSFDLFSLMAKNVQHSLHLFIDYLYYIQFEAFYFFIPITHLLNCSMIELLALCLRFQFCVWHSVQGFFHGLNLR